MPGGRMSARAVLRDSTLLLVGIMAGVLMSRSLVDIGGSDCGLMLSKRIEGPEIYYPHNSGELADGDVYTKTTLEAPTNRISTQQRKNAKAKRPKTLSEELKSSMRKPLFIGVVTAQKLLSTRAKAVNKTWGAFAPKLMFFSSQEREGTHGLPVVSLPGVDDTYPPQKKVYRMLKYMHDNYINDYNWFMRADDDVYVRVEKLINFLGQLDPNKELYIGQGGTGKPQDLERIKLRPNEHYCMGGPGVIFSRALLVRLAPYLEDCLLNEVVSWNEDLEVGRCISRRLGIQCTWNYEVIGLRYPGPMPWGGGGVRGGADMNKCDVWDTAIMRRLPAIKD